jgi:hypothetical protein
MFEVYQAEEEIKTFHIKDYQTRYYTADETCIKFRLI